MRKIGRPKKISEEDLEKLITLLEIYYIEFCKENCKLITTPAFGKYIRDKGLNIEDYDLRRCVEFNTRKEELNNQTNTDNFIVSAVSFQNLDTNQFLKKNNTPEKIRKALAIRDEYYEKISKSCIYYMKKYKECQKALHEKEEIIQKLNIKSTEEKENKTKLKDKINKLEATNKDLKDYIKTYVNQDIAAVLLQESNDKAVGSIDPQIVNKQSVKDNVMRANDNNKFENNIIQGLFNKIEE